MNDPLNLIDPYGLHDKPWSHSHSPTQLYTLGGDPAEAMTNPLTGHTNYSPSFDRLHPLQQESVEYHEALHRKYGIFMREKTVWRKEIEFIRSQLTNMSRFEPDRKILELWLKGNIDAFIATYGEYPCP